MDPLASVVALTSNKGGVGKTTSVIQIGAALASRRLRVLLVDADPQATLTEALLPVSVQAIGATPQDGLAGVVKMLLPVRQAIRRYPELEEFEPYALPLDIVPCNEFLVSAIETGPEEGRNRLIADRLDEVLDDYDFVVIDCGPSLTRVQVAALVASQLVVTPMKTDDFAFRAHHQFLARFRTAQTQLNPDLRLVGVIPSFFDRRHTIDRDILVALQQLHAEDGVHVFSPVMETTAFERSGRAGLALITRAGVDTEGRAQPFVEVADKLIAIREGG